MRIVSPCAHSAASSLILLFQREGLAKRVLGIAGFPFLAAAPRAHGRCPPLALKDIADALRTPDSLSSVRSVNRAVVASLRTTSGRHVGG